MKKRLISLIMALAMFAALIPQFAAPVFAAGGTWSGAGTESSPYLIADKADLEKLAADVNGGNSYSGKFFTLSNDVNLSGENWTPIGNNTTKFNGAFDGGNYTIEGMTINVSSNYQGLFGYVGGSVSNLTVKGTIDCKSESSQIWEKIGGAAGAADNSARLTNISSYVNITNSSGTEFKHIGGVAGSAMNGAAVDKCVNYGNITLDNSNDCIGGIVGYANNGVKITNSANIGAISVTRSDSFVGGILGYVNNNQFSGVKNCFNFGSVANGSYTQYCGAIVGFARDFSSDSIKDNYYLESSSVLAFGSGGKSGVKAESKTAEQFASGEVAYLLCGLTGAAEWGQNIGTDKYPVIGGSKIYYDYTDCIHGTYTNNESEVEHPNPLEHTYDENGVCSVCGACKEPSLTEDGVYQIGSVLELYWFANYVNDGNYSAKAVLTSDIDITGTNWTPIGKDYNSSFKGVFDGAGHKIIGLDINSSGSNCQGLFGYVYSSGEVKNLGVRGNVSGQYQIGGIAGISDGKITGCYHIGDVSGNDDVGGIVGGNSGEVKNCYNIGNVPSITYSGGICGYNEGGTITGCYYSADSAIGGIKRKDIKGSAEFKTAEQFASGEVAYLFRVSANADEAGTVWGQKIGTDEYPVIGGLSVYCDYTDCIHRTYTNNENEVKNPDPFEHKYTDGVCSVCGAYKEPSLTDGAYQIGSVTELYWFADYVNSGNGSANAVLTGDIDITGTDWTPIGENGNIPFNGVFDGAGHQISGLDINSPESNDQGLFGWVSGEIKNLGVTGNVSGYENVGGIAGQNYGKITNCYHIGDVSGNEDVGGIVGENLGEVKDCYNIGNVPSITYSGGICGYNSDEGTITGCYYSADSAIGGIERKDIKGSAEFKTAEQFASGEVAYLFRISANADAAGTVWGQKIGENEYPVIGGLPVYCNYTDCIHGTYTNNKDDIQNSEPLAHDYVNGVCSVCKAVDICEPSLTDGIYQIGSMAELYWFADYVNSGNASAKAVLTNDVDITGTNWTPIGKDEDSPFNGVFDGAGFKISGLAINSPQSNYQGLFGFVQSRGEVKNLGVTGNVSGDENVGGIAGFNVGKITGCYHIGDVSGDENVGGIVGFNYGEVKDCYNIGNIPLIPYSGGISGYNGSTGIIKGCYYSADSAIGGIKREDIKGSAEFKTAEQFKSGEVAYLFQVSASADAAKWGQKIGEDEYPVIGGLQVYYSYIDCIHITYTNNESEAKNPNPLEHNYDENGVCSVCKDVAIRVPSATDDGVYQIGSAAELYWFANYVNAGNVSVNAVLTSDIDITGTNWTPIGENNNLQFSGVFDGAGHKIIGLAINSPQSNYQGLFGYVNSSGEVKNLGVTGNVSGYYQIGGIAGRNYGKITGCYHIGDVSGLYVGGIAGENSGEVKYCYNIGNVPYTSCFGGICGYNSGGTITGCYYSADSAVGGINRKDIKGSAEFKTEEQFKSGEVAYLFRISASAAGTVWGQKIGEDEYPVIGGLPVYFSYTDCIHGTCTNDESKVENPNPLEHNYDENGVCSACKAVEIREPSATDDIYQIGSAAELYWFANYVNTVNAENAENASANAVLTSDIDITGTDWTPIGADLNFPFNGVFDGAEHKITVGSNQNFNCLFTNVGESGEVKNLGLSGSIETIDDVVGGIVMENRGTITNCYNTAEISGSQMVGGIALVNFGAITNCYNTAEISGSQMVGGIALVNFGVITNCYNTGKISGGGDIGGIAGMIMGGNITDCYNTGEISGNQGVGGIAGAVQNNSEAGLITITRSYNAGKISGIEGIGGIIGINYDNAADSTDCYCLEGSVNNENDEIPSVNGVMKTAEEFASGEAAYLLQAAQDDKEVLVWGQNLLGEQADAYPVLTSEADNDVYKITFNAGGGEYAVKYANPAGVKEMPEIPSGTDTHTFYKWSLTQSADGEEFTNLTPVSEDMAVYAVSEEMYGSADTEKEITGVYGTAVTQDLSEYMTFAGETESAGKFDYEITGGNEVVNATINGDIITIGSEVPAGRYTLTIKAVEKEPQVTLMSVDYAAEDVVFNIEVNIEKADGIASVSMSDYSCLETDVNPVPSSKTNGTEAVTYEYKEKSAGEDGYTSEKPTTAGEYTVKATFEETGNYNGVTAAADFKVVHRYSVDWSIGEDTHWHECECGERADEANHVENGGTVTKRPTTEETGIRTYSCEVCGVEMRTEEIAKIDESHTHSYKAEWTFDNEKHWHECDCGERADEEVHDEVGEVIKAPSINECGVMKYSCTICRRERLAEIPKLTPEGFGLKYINGSAVVTAAKGGTYTVIFAAYDENEVLTSVEICLVEFDEAGEKTVSPVKFSRSGANEVKVMLWDSIIGAKPLCQAVTE